MTVQLQAGDGRVTGRVGQVPGVRCHLTEPETFLRNNSRAVVEEDAFEHHFEGLGVGRF